VTNAHKNKERHSSTHSGQTKNMKHTAINHEISNETVIIQLNTVSYFI